MIRGVAILPGVPAAGHLTTGGYWHPGGLDTCHRCETEATPTRGANLMPTKTTNPATDDPTPADSFPGLTVAPDRCHHEHSTRDFDGGRLDVPCGAQATRFPLLDDAHSALLRAQGKRGAELEPHRLPLCDEHMELLESNIKDQAADDPYRIWIAAEPAELVIGYTNPAPDLSYVPALDGYRPGAAQHTVTVKVDLPPHLEPHQVAELVFIATNAPGDLTTHEQAIHDAIAATGYKGVEAHWSLSAGDTVSVDGIKLQALSVGWGPVEEAAEEPSEG